MNQRNYSFILAGFLTVLPMAALAGELSQGELISVVNEVTIGNAGAAKPNDKLSENTPVTTGSSSFAEVQFKDSSVLRLASGTKMAFVSKDRTLRLDQGSLLVNVPGGSGGLRVEADGISGEVTGTTLMASRDRDGNFGFVLLETSGTAKVTSNTGQTASLTPGQIALVRKSDGSIRVFELNLDSMIQFSPLFTSFERAMPGLDKVMAVADSQAAEVKNEIKSLLAYAEVGLKQEDPDKSPLSLLFGKTDDEIVASKNPFLGELSTAAGTEESGDGSGGSGVVLGAGSGKGSAVADARQPDGEEIASKSNPPSGDVAGGLGETDTAAGSEDISGTETAAGGGGAPDTQAPAPVGGGTSVNAPQATRIGGNLISS